MQRKLVPDVIKECRITTISPEKTAREAAALMATHNIGALAVTSGGNLVGIVTERDMMRKIVAAGEDPDATTVRAIMTPDPDTVTGDDLAKTALEMMVTRGYRHLPIITEGGVCGMVSVRDLYQAVQEGLTEDLKSCEAYVHGESYGVGA